MRLSRKSRSTRTTLPSLACVTDSALLARNLDASSSTVEPKAQVASALAAVHSGSETTSPKRFFIVVLLCVGVRPPALRFPCIQ